MPIAVRPRSAAEKLRGGYYTPAPLASFLARWVAGAGPRLLEPSCGDGAILAELGAARGRPGDEILGVELEPREAAKAALANPAATVVPADFFKWFTDAEHGAWDGVVGNPPFIRFGSWSDPFRARALRLMGDAGLRPTKFTNAWVPFVVAATTALRPGGRLGLVVPAELLQVNYAAELRAFLVDNFTELTAIAFDRLLFDGVAQEVVLLLGTRGPGPAQIRIVQAEDAAALPSPDVLGDVPHAPALRHESEKWTKYLLSPRSIELLREVRPELPRLGELADVDVGLVTGRNSFFVMRPSAGRERGIEAHLAPLVGKSGQLRGIRFDLADLEALRQADEPCELLSLGAEETIEDEALRVYLAAGEERDVHSGYKCSIRKRWWVVPLQWTPDAFLMRQIYDHPRIVANLAGATSTDTVHRVRMRGDVPATKLAAAGVNTVTFAFSEVLGRSYGGGVLELEPPEAEALPIPDPTRLRDAEVDRVDRLLREGRLPEALDFVDSLLLTDLGAERLGELRRAWERLRDRRLARGRRGQPSSGRSGGALR